MPLPGDLTSITVTGTYQDASGNPLTGHVTFTPTADLLDSTGHVVLRAAPLYAYLTAGAISIVLPCTDNATLNPAMWAYTVVEALSDGTQSLPNRTYTVQLPHTLGATVDISTVIPVNPPTSYSTWYGVLTQANTWAGANAFNGGVSLDGTSIAAPPNDPLKFLSGAGTWLTPGTVSAWVFDVRTYGAKGDGQVATDGTTTIGSNVVTCASGPFKASDVGKAIQIKGALASGATSLCTTITGYTSTTTVTMGANATAALTGNGLVLWATDDTTAIQATINAAFTHGQQQGIGIVSIPPAAGWFYGVAGPLAAGGATAANGQLVIPVQPDTGNKVELIFQGVTDGGTTRHWHQKTPQMSGSTLVSFGVFANATAQTDSLNASGNPAVISGQTGAYGYGGNSLLYNNVLVRMQGLQIYTPHSANGWTYGAMNMHGVAACCLENFGYGTTGTYANADFNNPNGFSAGLSIGVLLPSAGNNDDNQLINVICHGGYTRAIFLTEHSDWNGGTVLYCWSGICPVGNYDDAGGGHSNPGVGASHGMHFEQISIEGCNQDLEIIGPGQSGIGPMLSGSFDTEGASTIRDTLSGMVAACGTLYLKGNGGTPPTLMAGTNLQVICEFQFPGPVATPPTLTAGQPFQNPYGRWASVVLQGGTAVTSVQLGTLMGGPTAPTMRNVYTQAAAAMPLHTVRVPPQGWIQVNGTTAPTVIAWVLE